MASLLTILCRILGVESSECVIKIKRNLSQNSYLEGNYMKVIKFGGSSLADGPHVERAIAIVVEDPKRRIIVASAPGKRSADDVKVTDLLIAYATAVLHRDDYAVIQEEIVQRYFKIAAYFNLSQKDLQFIPQTIASLAETSFPNADYLMAAFKATGERLTAFLLAALLNHQKIPARFIDPKEAGIVVSDQHGPNNAEVLPETYEHLARLQSYREILVVPGFYGYTPAGEIATFSRGGSDITGAIIARGIAAECYENFTDVDAIYAANPAIVPNPRPIKEMTYREMRELAYAGFSVFHDEALIPAIAGKIPVIVKNTNAPHHSGTRIIPSTNFTPHTIITGVACARNFSALYLHKYLLNKEIGVTLKILKILSAHGISYEHMPSGIDDLTIIMRSAQLTPVRRRQITLDIQAAIQPDKLEWINDYAIIMVVGEGMHDRIGTTNGVTTALAQANVAIHMINQGASRISIMVGVRADDANRGINAIYNYFEKEGV